MLLPKQTEIYAHLTDKTMSEAIERRVDDHV